MKPVLFFSKRYLFSKSSNNAINTIVFIASLGVFFASMAFIIVLSGFSGIRTFNLNLLKLTDPDVKILPVKGKYFDFDSNLKQNLDTIKEIKAYSKVLEDRVFIDYHNKQKVAKIKGIDSSFFQVIPLDTTIFIGNAIDTNLNEALVGVGLANDLSIMVSTPDRPDVIKLIVPKKGKKYITNPANAFNEKYVFPVGIYQTSGDHDKIYIYTGLNTARELLGLKKSKISQIEIKADTLTNIAVIQNKLKNILGKQFKILNREEQNPLIFKMLNTENLMTYFILSLILILALFNITGTVIMIILDKSENIKTLKVLGLKTLEIRKIFLYQGILMTLISGIAGLVVGLILISVQIKFPFLYIPQTRMAYPVEIHLTNIVAVLLTLFFLSVISTLIAIKRIK